MGLNIKNPRTHDLVRRLAAATGQTQTSAVEDAVRRRLDDVLAARERADDAVAARRVEAARLLAELRADLDDAERARIQDAEASLYDASGLPR